MNTIEDWETAEMLLQYAGSIARSPSVVADLENDKRLLQRNYHVASAMNAAEQNDRPYAAAHLELAVELFPDSDNAELLAGAARARAALGPSADRRVIIAKQQIRQRGIAPASV